MVAANVLLNFLKMIFSRRHLQSVEFVPYASPLAFSRTLVPVRPQHAHQVGPSLETGRLQRPAKLGFFNVRGFRRGRKPTQVAVRCCPRVWSFLRISGVHKYLRDLRKDSRFIKALTLSLKDSSCALSSERAPSGRSLLFFRGLGDQGQTPCRRLSP